MNSSTAPSTPAGLVLPRSAPAAVRTTLQLLQRLRHGVLTVQLPDGTVQRFGHSQPEAEGAPALNAHLRLDNWNVCAASLKSGDIGFAETYFAGDWHTPNLSDLLRLLIANRRDIEDVVYGSWWGRLAYRLRHAMNRNSKSRSRKNIHAHYDLGNAFYSLWLDDTMNYSSALFESPEQSLSEAQHAKVRRALKQAQVKPGDRVLEIGCGWGALAEMATTEFQAPITGVTLSTEQLVFAQQRMAKLGVGDQTLPTAGPPQGGQAPSGGSDPRKRRSVGATLRLQDYRDINDGPFDAICSIEMVEAVGQAYWPTYFQAVHRLLKPGGRACVQSIVIDDALFERYLNSTDFIQQYIFPGGCLPSPSAFRAEAQRAGLEVEDSFAFGPDYARTLHQWRERFLKAQARVLQLGFDARFVRIWEFYLAYCEAAFAQANVDVVQFTLRRPA